MTDSPPYYQDEQVTLLLGDALEQLRTLPAGSVDCIVTSPPYFGLRDYGAPGQYGLEATPAKYVETMRRLFAEARRVLTEDGTLWLNLGDSYAAAGGHTDPGATSQLQGRRVQLMQNMPSKPADRPKKNLLGIPWRVAFALQDDGWILRNEIIWHKTNAMPESIKDRLSSRHEHLFLFAKASRYSFDLDPIREPHTMRPQRRPRGHKERQRLGVLPAQTHSTSQRTSPESTATPSAGTPATSGPSRRGPIRPRTSPFSRSTCRSAASRPAADPAEPSSTPSPAPAPPAPQPADSAGSTSASTSTPPTTTSPRSGSRRASSTSAPRDPSNGRPAVLEPPRAGRTQTPTNPERNTMTEQTWRGATEIVPDREVQRLAATGLVGYQQDRGRLLHCLHHKPVPASRYVDFQEVTADDLPDGGICVHPSCGADLLAAGGAR